MVLPSVQPAAILVEPEVFKLPTQRFLFCILAGIKSLFHLFGRGVAHCGGDLGKAVTCGHAPHKIAVAQNIK